MKDEILREVRDMVEAEFGFSLRSETRQKKYVLARAVYYRLCYQHTSCNLTEIGQSLDKHHATVLHGLKVFNSFKLQPSIFKRELEVYKSVSRHLTVDPIEEMTVVQKIQKEKEEVLKIHRDMSEKYIRLKEKHNRMLKYYSKYEKIAVEQFVEL